MDATPAQTLDVGLAAVGHHTEVVGVADAAAAGRFGPPRPPQEGPQED